MSATALTIPRTDSQPRLLSTGGTWGEIDLVASHRGVTLALTGRNYDVAGHSHTSEALAHLSPAEARRLSYLLHQCVAVAEAASPSHGTEIWSPATAAHADPRADFSFTTWAE